MNITIIGAGNVGSALGGVWLEKGHEVVYGVRDPRSEKAIRLSRQGGANVSVRKVANCVDGADVVVLATPWHATEAALEEAGPLDGTILMDCTNPLQMGDDGLELSVGHVSSGGEMVQGWAPGSRVVKTFNQTGFDNMADAEFSGAPSVMFYCGDDADAKLVCHNLIADIGFEPVDAGGLKIARLLEPHGMLWINLALKQGLGRDFAYALVRRTPR